MSAQKIMETRLLNGLYEGIERLQNEIEATGHQIMMGSEDEFYVFGEGAHDFAKDHGAELKSRFPLIHRIYKEADAVLLAGTKIRLSLPRIRKWEITISHQHSEGNPVSALEHVKTVNEIRQFIAAKQSEWKLQVDFGPRPLPDIQQALKTGSFPLKITEDEALAYLKEQVNSPHYAHLHEAEYLESDWPEISRILREHKQSILEASSFDALCSNQVIVPRDAPTSGVDLNVSLWKAGKNAFYDAAVEHKTSPLFWAVAYATLQLIGKESGSLLPSIQSYSPITFTRLGRTRFGTSTVAALTQSKLDGGCLKRSPPTEGENLVRARNTDHPDKLSETSLRLERREGESGGGFGYSNDLAHAHYVFTTLLGIRNGVINRDNNIPPSWEALMAARQDFNESHIDALLSFNRSALLKEGYGETLHAWVSTHAAEQIEIKARG
jgi:hypothetical protein